MGISEVGIVEESIISAVNDAINRFFISEESLGRPVEGKDHIANFIQTVAVNSVGTLLTKEGSLFITDYIFNKPGKGHVIIGMLQDILTRIKIKEVTDICSIVDSIIVPRKNILERDGYDESLIDQRLVESLNPYVTKTSLEYDPWYISLLLISMYSSQINILKPTKD